MGIDYAMIQLAVISKEIFTNLRKCWNPVIASPNATQLYLSFPVATGLEDDRHAFLRLYRSLREWFESGN